MVKKITKDDIAYYAIDVTGSSFIHFILKKDYKLDRACGVGDSFWLGKSDDLGNEFMVYEDTWDEFKEGNECECEDEDECECECEDDEKASDFLDDEAIELVDEVISNYHGL